MRVRSIRWPLLVVLFIFAACRDATTGVAGTFTVTGNVSNTAGLAVADVPVEVRLIHPTCESDGTAQAGSTKTSTDGVYTLQFKEMFDGCVRLIARPPGGTPVVVERTKVDVRPNRDYLIINAVLPSQDAEIARVTSGVTPALLYAGTTSVRGERCEALYNPTGRLSIPPEQ